MDRRKFIGLITTAIAAVPVLGKVVQEKKEVSAGGYLLPEKETREIIEESTKRYRILEVSQDYIDRLKLDECFYEKHRAYNVKIPVFINTDRFCAIEYIGNRKFLVLKKDYEDVKNIIRTSEAGLRGAKAGSAMRGYWIGN